MRWIFVLFALGLFVGIAPSDALAQSGSAKCSGSFEEIKGVCFPKDTGLSGSDLETVILQYMKGFLRVFGFLAIIFLVGTGLSYMMAGGDESKIESAKNSAKWAIIGILIALGGVVIIRFIQTALGG